MPFTSGASHLAQVAFTAIPQRLHSYVAMLLSVEITAPFIKAIIKFNEPNGNPSLCLEFVM